MNDTNLVPYDNQSSLGKASQAADYAARQHVLDDYLIKIADETRRRQLADIALFEAYLTDAGAEVHGLADDLVRWEDISHGLIKGFVRWQLQKGYAIGSINVRLATIKAYCHLATDAGYLAPEVYTLIQTVKGMRGSEGRNIDKKRETQRVGHKKKNASIISPAQVDLIKQQERQKADEGDLMALRDVFIVHLLADYGLRCGEVAALSPQSIDLLIGTMRFYRPKVDKIQVHRLNADTLAVASLYFKEVSFHTFLFPGKEEGTAIATRTINWRIHVLGKSIGIATLSPHDLRHYWATEAIKNGTDIGALQQAGGWSNPYMPLRYREDSKIANEGVKLHKEK